MRLAQFTRANARNRRIVFIWPRLGCKPLAKKPLWRLSNTKECHGINWLAKLSQYLRWLTGYKTVTLITYLRCPVVVLEGGHKAVALGGIMLRSTVFISAIGAASVLALSVSCFPASADEAADVQALKQEVAALQKKLNVLETQEKVDRAQQQAAIQSWETVTSGKDGDGGPGAWKPFGVKITFGGFVAAEGLYRDKDENTSIGSSFKAIPFNNSQQAHINELRGTAQQSRFSVLAEGAIDDHEKYAGYMEFDFLGAAPTANSNESNSYTPRLRQFYGTYDNTRDGWHFLAGQSWSLVTMFKEGLIPRKENVPWTIDAQYVPGFDWLRNPEVRIVKDFDKVVWLGIEAASPQGQPGGNNPGFVINTFPCTSQLDPQANCALDFMPDFTAKMAVDPGWGHYEIFGLARGFRDRISNPQGTAIQASNQEAYGFSGGGGAILPIWGDKLQLQGNVLYGQGVGRYDSAQLADFTTNPEGGVVPLTGFSIMAGLTSHDAVKGLDVYAYAGEEHVFNHSFAGTPFGYGNPNFINNSGCQILGSANCNGTGQLNDVWQVTGGFWHSLYDGDKGKVVWGLQDSFTVDTTPVAPANGLPVKADSVNTSMNVAMMSFRFYPKYGTLIGTKP
jgi:hypothetical protein